MCGVIFYFGSLDFLSDVTCHMQGFFAFYREFRSGFTFMSDNCELGSSIIRRTKHL